MMTRSLVNAQFGNRILNRRGHAYRVRLASSQADVRAAQNLRFRVFNVEMNQGLAEAYSTWLDTDIFDGVCDHLLVETVLTGEVVGTYRLQHGTAAAANFGYYSATEFDLATFAPYQSEIVELGRACVDAQHRNLAVLSLLWNGIAVYARERSARYLIGCSSLSTTDESVGAAVYEKLISRHAAPEYFRTQPLENVRCSLGLKSSEPVSTPKLLTAYLSIGAKICAPPAIDREFGTIDFLTLLDLDDLPSAFSSKLEEATARS